MVYSERRELDVSLFTVVRYTLTRWYEVIRGGRYAARYLRGAVAIVILAGRLRRVFLCAVLQLECDAGSLSLSLSLSRSPVLNAARARGREGKPGSYS